MCEYLSRILLTPFPAADYIKAKLILVRETLGDNQKRYDTRSDVWGFKFILVIRMQLVYFCGEVGLPPNYALELKSMGLELKAIKPNYWIT